MAATATEKTVNGNYGAHPNYNNAEVYQQGQALEGPAPVQPNEQNHAASTPQLSSTEIGWYFVEQYYNTMSKEPGRLYLYYTKKSQFVAGNEAEKVNVAVGQRKISEMIKEMDIQDCKVRVTNVDSQESAKGILVQVIGEMSNRAAPHRKFVQTFVLAEQPTGYYVLNDIFRYILDEEEEGEEEVAPNDIVGEQAPPTETEAAPPTLTNSHDPVEQQRDVEKVDRKLEREVIDKSEQQLFTPAASTPAASANEDPDPTDTTTMKEAEGTSLDTTKDQPSEQEVEPNPVKEIAQPEKPRDPDPTPIASPPKPAKATPAEAPHAPPKPAAPKTWANLVASKGAIATPANSASKPAISAASAAHSQKSNNTHKEASTPPTPAGEDSAARAQQNGGSGWQTAGTDKQRQGRQHSQSMSSNQENTLAYVKNVTDKVDASILKSVLAGFGKFVYFDVNRQKNCAFVEFAESAAYYAAVAANPHDIGGEQVFVEERRPRANAYGGNFNGRGGIRGGRGGSNDRPGSQGRGGFNKDSGRGAYGPRGRGGAMTPRGRGGQAQPA